MRYFFLLIAFVFCTLVNAQNTEKWKTYTFRDWCSLKIPNTMELIDANSVSEKKITNNVQSISENTELVAPKNMMIFQPKDFKNTYSTTSAHAFVAVQLFPSLVGITQSDVDALSEADIKELNSFWYKDYYSTLEKINKYKGTNAYTEYFQWFPLRRIEYSGRNALVVHYKQHVAEGSVDITEYHFFMRGQDLVIKYMYLDSEKSKWASDLNKVISTLKFL